MNTAPEAFSSALQMLTALGVVLGGLILIFYFMKRFMKRDIGGSKERLIRVVASQYIGIKKNIALVEVPGSILVVGVSNDNISLLTKIEDTAVLDAIRQNASRIAPTFTDHLQRLTARFTQVKNHK